MQYIKILMLLGLFNSLMAVSLEKYDVGKMILINSGSYIMGSDNTVDNEKPAHKVTIAYEFYMGKYEVTFKEYDKFCDETKRTKLDDEGWGRENRPVINVSWNDAKAYTIWLSEKTREKYRLPTEAEWEYVVKAGTKSMFSFGNSAKHLQGYAWYNENSEGKTHPVGLKKENVWGLHDLHGNVWEWCEDWFNENYMDTPVDGSANVKGLKRRKVLRGGSWYYSASELRSTKRTAFPETGFARGAGFRLVREK